MAASDEMQFAILGPSGAGKTTLLACMSEEFEEELPGAVFPAEPATFKTLNMAYNVLMRAANDPSTREFENGISSTEDVRDFLFKIKGRRAELPIKFYDFPGCWMSPSSPRSDTIIDIVIDSAVIIVAINTPYLMELDGKYEGQGCSAEGIEWILKEALYRDSTKDRLILFVPIKCEKYMTTPEDRSSMSRTIRNAFAGTLALSSDPVYRDKLAMALVPVQTVGNAKFRRFKISEDDTVIGEVCRKDAGKRFSPLNVEQPILLHDELPACTIR